jgi:hypothetical protein
MKIRQEKCYENPIMKDLDSNENLLIVIMNDS